MVVVELIVMDALSMSSPGTCTSKIKRENVNINGDTWTICENNSIRQFTYYTPDTASSAILSVFIGCQLINSTETNCFNLSKY